ncbi:TonB-dependent receptor [Lentisalinibacter salinarum]|uniref:TonB-dependent receptor n=1 Tax=Lentisalinibacter salinarum TaxID=2992239 RepID=UPI00386604E3
MKCCVYATVGGRHLLAGFVALTLLSGGAAQAQQETIEEVVVTATKRESRIQDVPFSINVQTQEDIRRLGATDLEELSRSIAGLAIQNLGPGQSQVAIRGVSAGQIVRDQPGVKEQVGVYLDESVISLSLFTPDFDLYDLNRVETLRGPQGTLFGSGSIGGTIRYITNQPQLDQFEGSVEAELNTVTDGEVGGHLKGMINAPFADGRAAIRAVGYTTQYGGFIDALREGGGVDEDVNSGSRNGARVALTFTPTDNLTITPRVVYQEIETDGFNRQEVYNLFANPYTTTRPAIQLGEREQYLLLREEFSDETLLSDLVVEATVGDYAVTYVGSIMDRDILVSRDASALTGSVSVDLGYPDEAVTLPSNLRDTTDLKQTTHELRVTSVAPGPLQWVLGAFISDTEREYMQRLPTPGYADFTDATLGAGTSAAVANGFPNLDSPFNSDLFYDIQQTAIFGEASYDVTDRLNITAGGRWYDFDEDRTISTGGLFAAGDSNVQDQTSSDGFTPRFLASFDVSENLTINAQAAQGFRLGGVNDPLNVTLCSDEDELIFGAFQDYDDETLWNYEIGLKSRFDNGITFNAAAFYADIEDLQVTLDAGSCSSRISFNVPEAESTGVEFELGGMLTEALEFSLIGSVINSEFKSTVTDATGSVLGGVQDGNRLASVPELQLAATGTYYFPLNFGGNQSDAYVSATVQHVGDRFTQPGDQVPGAGEFVSGLPFGGATGNEVTSVDLELDAYTIVNLRAGILKETWDAVLYIDNLTDENADLSFDRERGGRARLAFRTNYPRTVGVTVRMRF